MIGHKRKIIEKAMIACFITAVLLSTAAIFFMESENPATEQSLEDNNVEGVITDNTPSVERATRSDNPYTSIHLHPINATDDDGFNPDFTNLDEDAPGDGAYENTGKDSTYAWIECLYGPVNIPVGSIIHNITVYIGYYNDPEWGLPASHTGMTWNSTSGGAEQDIVNYTLFTIDRDEVFIMTSNLPSPVELNNGIRIRVSGHDTNGQNDVLHLDYLYFSINYSIPEIVINEVMFDPSGSDDNAEWVEIYNNGTSPMDLTGWSLADSDGNMFSLTGAGSIPAGGYLMCHLAQSGTNSTTDVYGMIKTEIVIQPNATVGKDTFLASNDPSSNFGYDPDIIVENTSTARNILIQFNLSNLPSTELITNAKVCLYRFSGNDNDATVRVHRMTQSWTETGATWNTFDGTNNWTREGGDFDGLEWDNITISGGTNRWYSWDISGLIKSWKNGTYNNYGLIFNSTNDSVWKGFYSSDYTGDMNLTPKLVVECGGYMNSMLNSSDSLALLDSNGNIVDYIAWGADPGSGDDDAASAVQWDDGNYIDTSLLLEGQTLGRDMGSIDTDQPEDWENATGYADPFGVDRINIYGPSPGEKNNDPVMGIPSITDATANPLTQYIDGYINITCNVTDLVTLYGAYVNITLPGGGYVNDSMLQGPGDQWYYNDTFSTLGIYQYTIWANNTNNIWNSSSTFNFTISISQSILSNSIVTPVLGYIDSWFNFTVGYSHPLNKGPDIITLNLTGPSGGIYDPIEVDVSDVDYTDGKLYYYNMSGLALGSYSFHFAANDTYGTWSETGEIFQPSVVNRIPSLSASQINPVTGYIDTGFNFTVTYTDLDGHAPDIITVNISNFGILDMIELDPFDIDYTNGKLYYHNVSGLSVGLYSFHFAANDTHGDWAVETPEIDAPEVLPSSATLTALDEAVEYSDNAFLNATLMGNGTPIAGEDVAFYIDMDHNGIYEPGEFVGSATTLADGSVSVIYNAYLVPNSYDFAAVYTGSGGFIVGDGEALLTIDPKQATLTALNDTVEEGEVIALNATLIDVDGNPIASEQVNILLDKNQNEIYEGSEFIGSKTTSAGGLTSITFTVNLFPGNYVMVARYMGSGNYTVSEIEGILTVRNTGNSPPVILGVVPSQVKLEDSPPWTLDLTSFEADVEDTGADLKWYLTGIDNTLYSVTGLNSSDDVFTFIPQENAYGNDEVILWLVDGSGDRDSQVLWINITPVNDLPYFNPLPPNIYVHYDDPSNQEDDPAPWNYIFYVHDIETPKEDLIITTSEPTTDSGEGYAIVDGLEVTFHYPRSRVGESVYVTLTLNDGTDTAQTTIIVNITSDWVPELVTNLPDVIIEENSMRYNVFDLDDYFTDRDHDSLFFSSGYFHLIVDINPDNTVDITAIGQWSGSELVTFRAKDPTGAIVEDTITVTVVPVNDGPVISGAPDLIVHFDYSYGFDFSPYISDLDNSNSELSLWTSVSTDYIWIQKYNNLGIVVNYPESMNGMTIPVIIYVSDGIETASQGIQITVTDNFPPEIKYKLPDVSFEEDTFLEDAILLSYYFIDIDGDALFFTNGSTFINITINDDNTVDFGAPENWFGFERVTFRATDPTGAIAEDTILIVVVPVNDPPTIEAIPSQEKKEGDQWILDLSQYIDDVDNDVSELIITVENEAGNGYVTLTGNILIFQYPEGVSNDIVTITISDGELETQRSFTVNLISSTPVAPSIWDMIPWPWMLLILLTAVGGAFAFYRKKSKYLVHEAFLIHEKGLPIAHASHVESSELEDVVVSGMFTAVQDFISDAFSGKVHDEGWKLDEMKFGENKILIERADDLYLAVIFEGNGKRLGNRVRKLLKKINGEYGEQLADWDGDMTQLTGISAAIAPLISKRPPKHVESEQTSAGGQTEIYKEELENPQTEIEGMEGADLKEQDSPQEGVEDVQAEEAETEEVEVYECPVCKEQIGVEDTKCSGCGVEFTDTEDSEPASSEKNEDNEMKGSKEATDNNEK